MLRCTVFILVLPYLVSNLQLSKAESIASKRFSLIHHEPPVESDSRGVDRVTEHNITQRLDNFDHQNPKTFQMVREHKIQFDRRHQLTQYYFSDI